MQTIHEARDIEMDTISAFNSYEDDRDDPLYHRSTPNTLLVDEAGGGEERRRNRGMIVMCAILGFFTVAAILNGPGNYLRGAAGSFYDTNTDETEKEYDKAFLGFEDYAILPPYGSEILPVDQNTDKGTDVGDNEPAYDFFVTEDDIVIQDLGESSEPDTTRGEEIDGSGQDGQFFDGKLQNETYKGKDGDYYDSQGIENSGGPDVPVEGNDENSLSDTANGDTEDTDLEDDDVVHFDDFIIQEIKQSGESDAMKEGSEEKGKFGENKLKSGTEDKIEDEHQYYDHSIIFSQGLKGSGESNTTSDETVEVKGETSERNATTESNNTDLYQLFENDEPYETFSNEGIRQVKNGTKEEENPEYDLQTSEDYEKEEDLDDTNQPWSSSQEAQVENEPQSPVYKEYTQSSEFPGEDSNEPKSNQEGEEDDMEIQENKEQEAEEKHHNWWPFNGREDTEPSSAHKNKAKSEQEVFDSFVNEGKNELETSDVEENEEGNNPISQYGSNDLSENEEDSEDLFGKNDVQNENLFGPSDFGNNGESKYPEYVVHQKEDPLYPDQNTVEIGNVANQATSAAYDYSPVSKEPAIETNISNPAASAGYEYTPITQAPVIQTNVENHATSTAYDYAANQATSTAYEYSATTKAPVLQPGTSTMIPPFTSPNNRSLEQKFGDLSDPLIHGTDVPFFWYIPRSAATSLQTMLTRCQNKVIAGTKGSGNGVALEPTLRVVEPYPHENFLNVDLRTQEGIDRANRLGAIESKLVDVVFASRLYQVSDIFHPPSNRGRCFTMIRHPVERAVSLFYYLRNSNNEKFRDMTIEEYAKSDKAESDWMTRSLSQKLSAPVVKEEDLIEAKEFLRTKCLVGLMSNFDESKKRFERYFGWATGNFSCENEIMKDLFAHKLKYKKVRPGSATYKALASRNQYDMMLYEYAMELFEEQKQLV